MSSQAMNATDRSMPSVNDKKRGGKGVLVFLLVIAMVIGLVAGGAYYAMNRLKASGKAELRPKQKEEAAPIVKSRKFDEDAPPAAEPGQGQLKTPGPAPEIKVPAVADATQVAADSKPIGIRGNPTESTGRAGPRLNQPAQATVTEIQPRPVQQGNSAPNPIDAGFFVNGGQQPGVSSQSPVRAAEQQGGSAGGLFGGGGQAGSSDSKSALGSMLNPTSTPSVRAGRIANRSLMVTEGSTAECVLRTKIVASLPGMVICRLSSPIYSANGKLVLVDVGSIVTGEQAGKMKTGETRLFVLWRRIETPEGVTIKIDAPAADQLGGSGVDGEVDNKWAERIGASLMLSIISDAFAYQAAKDSAGSAVGNSVYQNTQQSGKSIAEKVLESTINIPPTLTRAHGDKLMILIPRDLDFSSVYEVKTR